MTADWRTIPYLNMSCPLALVELQTSLRTDSSHYLVRYKFRWLVWSCLIRWILIWVEIWMLHIFLPACEPKRRDVSARIFLRFSKFYLPAGIKMQSPGFNVVQIQGVFAIFGCSNIFTISGSIFDSPRPSVSSCWQKCDVSIKHYR